MSTHIPESAFRITASTVRDRFAEISKDLAALQRRCNQAETARRNARIWWLLLAWCLFPLALGWACSLSWVATRAHNDVVAVAEAYIAAPKAKELYAQTIWAGTVNAGHLRVWDPNGVAIEIDAGKGAPSVALHDIRPPWQKQGNGPLRVTLASNAQAAGLAVYDEGGGQGQMPSVLAMAGADGPAMGLTSQDGKWSAAIEAPATGPAFKIMKDNRAFWSSPSMAGK
jgi:hypothetical protein